jgi:thiamine biosynthesis lipoprotein
MEKIAFDPKNKSVRLPQGGRLDFGGIGKGYALDSAARVLRAAGVRSAFINFGGQVLALTPPRESRAWPVDIAAPDKSRRPVRTLYLHTGSAATSGVSERPAHIRHPESGLPVKSDQSVTVIAKNGASADAWSTALFVSGRKTRHPAFSDCAAWTSPGFFRPRTRLTGDCSSYTKQP